MLVGHFFTLDLQLGFLPFRQFHYRRSVFIAAYGGGLCLYPASQNTLLCTIASSPFSWLCLAQTVPVQTGTDRDLFLHIFNNGTGEGVIMDPACTGATLLEHAVGSNMATFVNTKNGIRKKQFKDFRVLITQPDPTSSVSTFWGVMTHGQAPKGRFETTLCAEV
ncbi:hypothetical protein DFH09DRAFT_1327848 [Mycena vulgaris]|nr:hypothetical protein DFH09DRAFT_1327848 [Mycena vulgaris]